MKIITGLSGGVDSSVAALMLLEQGHEVEALFMKNWNEEKEDGKCHWEADVEDALQVCDRLQIPLNTVDLSADYWDSVFTGFIDEYNRGLTPNPDILCNQEVKFRAFMDHALGLGAKAIATGHYARNRETNGARELLKGMDNGKDQSYFLCRLGQQQLQSSYFPVGELQKSEVRTIARRAGLATHNKKDSTGICFIGERSFRDFLGQYLPENRGHIVSVDGRTLGEHDGVHFFTLGQRHGLGIGGVSGQDQQPWYVVDKNTGNNTLIVAQGHDHPLLYTDSLRCSNVHWIGSQPATVPFQCHAKTRYRQPDQDCSITELDDDSVVVEFSKPQRAVTPGQYVVFYTGDVCLGGGVIRQTSRRTTRH